MSSSTEQAEDWPATQDGQAGVPRGAAQQAAGEDVPAGRAPGVLAPAGAVREHRPGNGFATAALVLGGAGVTLVTILPGVVSGILGLRRARSHRAGRVRSWLGIGLCAFWAAAGAYLLPHLLLAADPGCTAYKGPALTAYNKAISDFRGDYAARNMTADVSQAISALGAATSRSRDPATARAMSELTQDLRMVLGEIHAGAVIPGDAMTALNRAAARADAACGTLHV